MCVLLIFASLALIFRVGIAVPSNDLCADSSTITSLPFTSPGTTVDSTTDFDVKTCFVSETANGVWYRYTPSETKIITFSVTASNGSGLFVRVFSGECDALFCITFKYSEHTFLAEAGTTYRFLVSKNTFDPDGISFSIGLEDSSNDECTTGTEIKLLPFQSSGTTVGSLPDFDVKTCSISGAANGVWYSYTPSETKIITFSITASYGSNIIVRVFSGDCDALFCITFKYSEHTFLAEAGTTYRFLVSKSSFDLGIPFSIGLDDVIQEKTVTQSASPNPSPDNDFIPSMGSSLSPSINPTHLSASRSPSHITEQIISSSPSPSGSIGPSDDSKTSIEPNIEPSIEPSIEQSIDQSIDSSDDKSMGHSVDPSIDPSIQPSTEPHLSLSPSIDPITIVEAIPEYASNSPSDSPSVSNENAPPVPTTSNNIANSTSPPTNSPSTSHSNIPSNTPSITKSDTPSSVPSTMATNNPSSIPSNLPTRVPSSLPSATPSLTPSSHPSRKPSSDPTWPSDMPSRTPSDEPSNVSSKAPSESPSDTSELKLCSAAYRTCFRRAFDPNSKDECDSLACAKPYVEKDESLLKGTIYLTLLQGSTIVDFNKTIEMEELLLNFLADNIGSDNTFRPVCVHAKDVAYDTQHISDDDTDIFVKSTSLEAELTFVGKIGARRIAEMDFDGDSLGLELMPNQHYRHLKTCTVVELAMCCSQYTINNDVGKYCTTLGCDLRQCGRGRRRGTPRNLEADAEHHSSSSQAMITRETKSGKSTYKWGKSGKGSKLFKAGAPEIWHHASEHITAIPSNAPSKFVISSKPTDMEKSAEEPQSDKLPNSGGKLRVTCSEYGLLKSEHFKAVVLKYTSFKPLRTRALLNVSNIESVATCSANRYSIATYGVSTLQCEEFENKDCANNEDLAVEENSAENCISPLAKRRTKSLTELGGNKYGKLGKSAKPFKKPHKLDAIKVAQRKRLRN